MSGKINVDHSCHRFLAKSTFWSSCFTSLVFKHAFLCLKDCLLIHTAKDLDFLSKIIADWLFSHNQFFIVKLNFLILQLDCLTSVSRLRTQPLPERGFAIAKNLGFLLLLFSAILFAIMSKVLCFWAFLLIPFPWEALHQFSIWQ